MEAENIISWWGWMILIPIMIVGTSIGLAIFMDLFCTILERNQKEKSDE